MGLLALIRETLRALDAEDEIHLAFIFGYRIDTNKFWHTKRLLSEGVFLRSLVFFKQVFFRVNTKSRNEFPVTYLLYAGTDNQFRALLSTAQSLKERPLSFSFVCDYTVKCLESRTTGHLEYVSFSLKEAMVAAILFLLRAKLVLSKLSAANNTVARVKYFDKFAQAYIYIPYFLFILQKRKPAFVVMSNDHNTPNRCLKLAAERLGIKTVFMQHGSGNVLLPPLDYDFAFLDGYKSVEKYLQCAVKAEEDGESRDCGNTTIFLSGSKWHLPATKKESAGFVIGVAVNPHDRLDEIVRLLNSLTKKGIDCVLRAHPAQEKSDILALNGMSEKNTRLQMSRFDDESVDSFLSQCSLLIAGNSSIHLEAALAHIPAYYYQFGDSGLPFDYLHHVRGGIATVLPSNFEELELKDILVLSKMPEDIEKAIRRFSESFGTEWEGMEGELVVKTLVSLTAEDSGISNLYRRLEDAMCFEAIFGLKSPGNLP